ncbi:MAG: hypothetical protein HYU39_06015 [Thaumarchaeota archaeon]|nr:hypothetical protein [Nitrososphaerota archaeon]
MELEADLSVNLCGLELKNPLIAEAAGYAINEWSIRRLLKSGLAAICTKSTTWDPMAGYPRRWEATPQPRCYWVGDDDHHTLEGTESLMNPGYKKMAEFIKSSKPLADNLNAYIFGSLSPRTANEAAMIAREFEKAGAAAIHCDFGCASARVFREIIYPGRGYDRLGGWWSEEADRLAEVLKAIKDAVDIPIMPKTVVQRYFGQPDLIFKYGQYLDCFCVGGNAQTLDINVYTGKRVYSKTSGRAMSILSFRVLADMARLNTGKDIEVSGGIHTWEDVIKSLMLGASAVGLCTAIYRDINIAERLCRELEDYMVRQALDKITDIKGTGLKFLPPSGYPRLQTYQEEQARELAKEYDGHIRGENPVPEELAKELEALRPQKKP